MTTPSPEAIEAAEVAVRKYYSAGGWVRTADVAKLAVQAAYPLMEAQAKADAWDEGYGDCLMYHRSEGTAGTQDNPYRAATIERKDS